MLLRESYAKVRILDAPRFLDRPYDYFIPGELASAVSPGSFVTVPFGGGNRPRIGLVTVVAPHADHEEIKPILTALPGAAALDGERLGLVEYLCEHTLCTAGEAVRAMIPAGALSAFRYLYMRTEKALPSVLTMSSDELFFCQYVSEHGECSEFSLRSRFGADYSALAEKLCRRGLIARIEVLGNPMKEQKKRVYSRLPVTGELPRLGARQRALLDFIGEEPKEDSALREAGFEIAVAEALCGKGLLRKEETVLFRDPYADRTMTEAGPAQDFELNGEQSAVFEEICRLADDGEGHGVLLHGVTGSGKTPVMLRVIDEMLKKGRGVIVLLPEIALTPQTLSIFSGRYGARVAVMHSALSAGERFDTYRRVKEGLADVVVGTRSAVFAPVKNLGLIVLDEEHEHTYKSDMDPKYHARDVARYRCAAHHALMLLCSATPSLESYKRALDGRYTLLTLKNRFSGAALPQVRVADMREEPDGGAVMPIGSVLREALCRTVREKHQAVLFLNRRGYNHAVSCRGCGKALCCPDCSVALTYHTKPGTYKEGFLVCHFCGRRMPLPTKCPSCGSEHLSRVGYGTQRVEEELSALLPDRTVLRMDTDTTGTRFSYDELLGRFRRREADVLLGTQMVTKGHDFPHVTLVGVLLADASLYLDDYRAAERTFSMLTQVIGRAGRAGEAGEAVIQTSNPDSEVIRLACAQDYPAFYHREIRLRRLLAFPPFCDIVLLTVSHGNEKTLYDFTQKLNKELYRRFEMEYPDVKNVTYGPFEAPVYRAQGKYRLRIVIKCVLNRRARALFSGILNDFSRARPGDPLLSVDFNPSNL